MPDRFVRLFLTALLCAVLFNSSLPRAVASAPASDRQCFTETHHCTGGRFLAYWREHGGLALNGYPLTEPLREALEDGREYTVQYFERVRLEYHPDNPAPYDVLLGQFGRRLHPPDPPAAQIAGAQYFAETGHNVNRAEFLAYWREHGGLAQFGLPLSEETTERLEDGQEYRVQYFERARFEWHPANSVPDRVLLGQFGRRVLGERGTDSGSIVYLDTDRRTVRRVRPDGTQLAAPFVLPLGQYDTVVYFSVNRLLDTAVYSFVDATSRTRTAILHAGRATVTSEELLTPLWSPDGRYLLAQRWVDHVNLKFEDMLYDATTGGFVSLGEAHFPGWDLDSQHFIYSDGRNIFRVPVAGGAPVKLTELPTDDATRWRMSDVYALSDGRLAFHGSTKQDPDNYRWWSVVVGGTTPSPLGDVEEPYGQYGRYPYHVIIHPLGTWLAYTATTAGGGCATPSQALQDRPIVVRTLAAGPRTYHLDRAEGFGFAPDEGMEFEQYSWSPTSDWLALGLLTYRCDPQTYGRPTVREPAIYLWTADPIPGEPSIRSLGGGWFPTWVP